MGSSVGSSEAMARIIVSVALLCGCSLAQYRGDASLAKILQEQRFNAGKGAFGSAFAQEDGVVYREESKGNNERIGQYSYTAPNGKQITVKYSAGVDGFRILEGDHIPSGGQNSARASLDSNGATKEYDYEYYEDIQPESAFVNPYDPSHQIAALKAGDLAGHLAGRHFPSTPRPLPGVAPTPRNRFFPPGQIKLDRFAEGFNFNFKSQK